ncbi:AraC family transcriptional regulator [Luteolibacter sp. AS25]|uniref:AraC family transcriptional regulator n=1 Tax=Luteolibacter sp. AS25 TaxID=3135776 RepID=UPI00398BA84A
MQHTIADGIDYFGANGFPVTVRRVATDTLDQPSHPHDLTRVEHSHDFHELAIVAEGRAIHSLEGNEFPVSRGDVLLLQGNQRHFYHQRENLKLLNVMYDADHLGLPESELRRIPGYCAVFMLEPVLRRQSKSASQHLHLDQLQLAHVESLVETMEIECSKQRVGYEVALRAKLLELIVYLSRTYEETDRTESHALLRMGTVIGALEQDFSREWKIDELAKIAHMSRSNLMRIFRKATGQTPIEYLQHLRVQKSMELLRNTELSVTEVAMQIGFNDSNYFTRCFRKISDQTPRQYRNKGQLPISQP